MKEAGEENSQGVAPNTTSGHRYPRRVISSRSLCDLRETPAPETSVHLKGYV